MTLRHFLAGIMASVTGIIMAVTPTDRGYTNPVIPGFYPDPSVCRVGDDFYLVNSSFQYFPGVPLFHSRDLIHWQQIGNVLDRESQLKLKGANSWTGIYAPTIRYNDGRFYMVTTNIGNAHDGKINFFVTAESPQGPWSDPVWLDQGGIDPSLYFEDGRCYLVSNPDAAIRLCEIDPVSGKQLSPTRIIWEGTGGRHPEAPHIYRKDGYYYLMIAEGGTEMGHSVTIARSRDIYGPYRSNPDNPILYHQRKIAQSNPIQGTGHADLVQAPDSSWWMVCLAFRPQVNNMHLTGRETYLAPVEWNADGWPVVNGNGTISTFMDVPTLPQQPALNRAVDCNFTTLSKLGPQWIYLRNPDMSCYWLTPEGLLIKGTHQLDVKDESPSMVAIRQQDIDFTATTTLTLVDASPGATAGMTIFMDGDSHYDLYIRQNPDSSRSLVLYYRLHSIKSVMTEVPLTTAGDVTLKVDGTAYSYRFSYSVDNWLHFDHLGSLDTRYLSTETAGGFTGITIGLFATAPGSGLFSRFTYTPLDQSSE